MSEPQTLPALLIPMASVPPPELAMATMSLSTSSACEVSVGVNRSLNSTDFDSRLALRHFATRGSFRTALAHIPPASYTLFGFTHSRASPHAHSATSAPGHSIWGV